MITAAEATEALDNPDTVVECYDGVNQHVVRRGRLVGYSQCPTVVIKTDSHPFSWVAHLARIVPRDARDDFEVAEEGEPLHAAYTENERLRAELDDAWAVLGPDGMSLASRIRSLMLERDSWQKLAEKLAPMQTIEPDADQQLRESRNANHVTQIERLRAERNRARTDLADVRAQCERATKTAEESVAFGSKVLADAQRAEVALDNAWAVLLDADYGAGGTLAGAIQAVIIDRDQARTELRVATGQPGPRPGPNPSGVGPFRNPNAPWSWPPELVEAVGPKIRDAINSAWDDQYVAEQAAPVFKRWNPDHRPSPEAVRLAAELIPDDGPKHAARTPTADDEGTYPFAPDYTETDLNDTDDGRAVLLHNCPPEHALVCGHTHLDDGTSRMCTEPVNGLQCPVHGQRTAPADPKRHRFELHYPTHHDLDLIAVLGED